MRYVGILSGITVGLTVAAMAGCAAPQSGVGAGQTTDVAPQTGPASGQADYPTTAAAIQDLAAAAQSGDKTQLRRVLGPALDDLTSGDADVEATGMKRFAQRLTDKSSVEQNPDGTATMYIGQNQWPFPIPLEKDQADKWYFDTVAGEPQVWARRVGRNELDVIAICQEYVAAQQEYVQHDWDNDGIVAYARHFMSTPGKKDGLYWKAASFADQSPLGPLVAEASQEGYFGASHQKGEPFHGYHFHILTKQGSHAPGGAYNYVVNGNMVGGFALIAWPADYGHSGVMTFEVNQNGRIYQKDLGEKTDAKARAVTAYDPDATWSVVK